MGRGTVDHTLWQTLAESAFSEWVVRPPGAETIRHPLLLAISFGRHVPPGPPSRVHPPASRGARGAPPRLRDAGGSGGTPSRAAGATHTGRPALAFGIAYERAVADWFEGLPKAIRSPTTEPSADA